MPQTTLALDCLLEQCLALPLVSSWRKTLQRRLEQRQVEDWASRLEGAARGL
ncbi:hypothetical protein QEM13_001773 [Pseudomonas putida]|nr:hypothetical protein [Pseudomonas putida]